MGAAWATFFDAVGGEHAEADEQGSAGFDEVAAGEGGAEDIYLLSGTSSLSVA